MEKDLKFAPRDSLRFLQRVEKDFLVHVLEIPDAFVTDQSSLRDFLNDSDISRALRPSSKPGFYVFSRARPHRFESPTGERITLEQRFEQLKRHKWEYIEVEEQGVDHRGELIKRTKDHFGVDIDHVFDSPFSELFLFIGKHLKIS